MHLAAEASAAVKITGLLWARPRARKGKPGDIASHPCPAIPI